MKNQKLITLFLLASSTINAQETIAALTKTSSVNKDASANETPAAESLPVKNTLLLTFCDSVILKQVGNGKSTDFILSSLDYAGYDIKKGKKRVQLETFLEHNTFLILRSDHTEKISFWTNGEPRKMKKESGIRFLKEQVKPGDILYFYYVQPGRIRDRIMGHLGIVKQVHNDGTISVYEQYYEDGTLMRKNVSVNSYTLNQFEYLYFARP